MIKLNRWYVMLCLALISELGTISLCAQEIVDTVRFQKIDSVMVIGVKPRDKVIPSQTLSSIELERLSSNSVADAIRYFSGVQIKDYGGIGGLKTVNVRSMGSQHVGVFYDGVQLGNAQNGQIDLGKYSLDNMSAITLYNGQKSSGVQSAKDYSSASTVYLQSKLPQFEIDKSYNLKATIKAGSFATLNPSVLYEQKLTPSLSNSFSVEYLTTSGEYPFSYTKEDGYDTTAVRQNGDVRALRIENGLFGKTDKGDYKLKLYFYDSERGYPGAFVREEPGVFKNEDRQWDRNFFVQSGWNHRVNEWYRLSLNTKYSNDYLHYLSDPRLDVTTMYVDNTYLQQEGYLSLAQEFRIYRWWDVNFAVDAQYNTLDADLTDFVYPSRLTALAAVASSFNFGKLKFQASLLNTFVQDWAQGDGVAADSRNVLTPTAVVSYKPIEGSDFMVRAFYKRIFRMPTLNDLYYTYIGNKYLNPEYTTQYDLGVDYSENFSSNFYKRFEISVDAYYNEVQDKIVAVPTSNQFQWTMMNLGLVKIKGLDVVHSSQMEIQDVAIGVRLNYTYQMAQDFTDSSSEYYGGLIPYCPIHSGSAIVSANYRGWGLNYSFIYTGERYDSVANIAENYVPSWYTSDVSISKVFPINKSELKVALDVNNLLDQQYEVVNNYPMPGINFKLSVSYTL